MMVLRLERVPATLRGELTRGLLEPATGVFVGSVSALVRDQLWEMVGKQRKAGAAILVCNADNEQGFELRVSGSPARNVVDFEGLALIRTPHPVPKVEGT